MQKILSGGRDAAAENGDTDRLPVVLRRGVNPFGRGLERAWWRKGFGMMVVALSNLGGDFPLCLGLRRTLFPAQLLGA